MTENTFKEEKISNPALKEREFGPYQGLDIYSLVGAKKVEIKNPLDEMRAELEAEHNQIREEAARVDERAKDITTVAGVLEKAAAEISSSWKDAEQEMVKMVLMITEKIIEHEVTINPEIILKMVRGLVDQAGETDKKILRLSAADYKFLKESTAEAFGLIEKIKGLEIVQDEEMKRGDCRLDAASLRVDGSISKKIKFLWDSLNLKQEVASAETPAEAPVETKKEDA